MSSIGHHLVRRAFDVTQEHLGANGGFAHSINPADEPQGQDDTQIKAIAMWGIGLIWVTGVIYLATMSAVSISESCASFNIRYGKADYGFRFLILMAMSLLLSP